MADIVPTLFGFSPQMYQQQQQQRADEQALLYAKLDPFEQANYAIGRGAYGLAGAIGGALGGQDPELQRITMRQQIASQIDPNDLSTFQKAFAALAPTDPEGAMMVRAELEKVQMGQAKLASENALTAQRSAAATASLREKEGVDPVQQLLRTGKFTPASVAAYQKSGEIADLKPIDSATKTQIVETTGGQLLVDMGTGNTIANLGGSPDRRTRVEVNANTIGENEFTKSLGAADAKRVDTALTTRDSAITTLTSLNELSKLDDSGLVSGSFATGRVGATNLLNTLGLASPKDQVRLSNSENYTKEAGTVILGVLGGRLGAGFSNEDRKFIEGLVPKLENSAMARRQLIDFMIKKNTDVVNETTRLENYARKNKGLSGFKPTFPLAAPSANRFSNLSDADLDAAIAAAKARK